MTEKHESVTFQTGEGRLTLAGIGASLLALVGSNVEALSLDHGERKIVLLGAFAQAIVLTIARTLAKLRRGS